MNSAELLQAYKGEVERIARRVGRGEPLSEGERYFATGVLESFAASLPSMHFYLNQFVEPALDTQKEGQ